MRLIIMSVLASMLAFGASLVNAASAPLGVYEQTSSTAGDCPSCEITLNAYTPNIFQIESNNLWLGWLAYSEESDHYEGLMEWRAEATGMPMGIFKLRATYFGNTLRIVFTQKDWEFYTTFRVKP